MLFLNATWVKKAQNITGLVHPNTIKGCPLVHIGGIILKFSVYIWYVGIQINTKGYIPTESFSLQF